MKKGFTLIELIVSLTLAAIMFLSGTFLLSSYLRSSKKIVSAANSIQLQQSILAQITKDVRSADSIAPSTPAQLIIKTGTSIISYDYANKKVRRRKDGSSAYLTEDGQVNTLSFSFPRSGFVIINLDYLKTGAFCRNEK